MNAIILAAGMGTRLRPLTDNCPKCMVEVNGTPIVERQIRLLQDAGIQDITLIGGYCAEALKPICEKYGVELIVNDKYATINNIWSMVCAEHRFNGNTWVIEGDVLIDENHFLQAPEKSTYFGVNKPEFVNEWQLVTESGSDKLIRVDVGSGSGTIMSGISFWKTEDAKAINVEIKRLVDAGDYENLFWDNAAVNLIADLDIHVKEVGNLYEIDTPQELKAVEQHLSTSPHFLTIKENCQLQLLITQAIHNFCVERGLRYSLAYGSLIGALRHADFIPWDDDMDLWMPREDFEIFMNEFNHPRYKAVNTSENSSLKHPFGKVVDTTTLTEERSTRSLSKGVFVDIFPIDGFPAEGEEADKLFKRVHRLFQIKTVKDIVIADTRAIHRNVLLTALKLAVSPMSYNCVLKALRKTMLSHSIANSPRAIDYNEFNRQITFSNPPLAHTHLAPFGKFEFLVPDDADSLLTSIYGNWRQLPPVEQRKSHHSFRSRYK